MSQVGGGGGGGLRVFQPFVPVSLRCFGRNFIFCIIFPEVHGVVPEQQFNLTSSGYVTSSMLIYFLIHTQ